MRIGKVLAPLLIVFLIDACWNLRHPSWGLWAPRDNVPPFPLRVSLRDTSAVILVRGHSEGDSLIGWTLPTGAPGDTLARFISKAFDFDYYQGPADSAQAYYDSAVALGSVRVSYPWERIKTVHYLPPDRSHYGGWCYPDT